MTKHVFFFGNGRADGGRGMKSLLGGKGANLAEMTWLGIPVPPGFTLTTEVCLRYLETGAVPQGTRAQVEDGIRRLEEITGKRFGGEDPLLLSVRSGAAISMPGMMDTILNLGLDEATVGALAQVSSNQRFAYDSYRRFVQMYADVVLGVDRGVFEEILDELKEEKGVESDTDLEAEDLDRAVRLFQEAIAERSATPFPEDPERQLWGAIEAVFRSWDNPRAVNYRKANDIPDDLGTAVNVMAMVYGNRGPKSGTGVAFTRDPSTGERELYGEFLPNAQGEDVVAGVRDPLSLDQMEEHLPGIHEQLATTAERLEHHYRDMQDLEFTVEDGHLYLLQTRTGKRTAQAAVRMAVEMAEEGLIGRDDAVRRVDPGTLDQLLHPMVDPEAEFTLLATGLPASPGAASGQAAFTADAAVERSERGDPVILLRPETSPDDFHGMVAARAIVTARGGMTSHAAVVARGMGKCCVVGARELEIDPGERTLRVDGRVLGEGDWLTVDGSSGRIIEGQVPTIKAEPGAEFETLIGWADEIRGLGVRANADTPEDAEQALRFGAEGIGLCRTEHMFFRDDRIQTMREMILAADEVARRRALQGLLPMQREDFRAIFEVMDGLPVTIRLLDPPLHEFLPAEGEEAGALAERLGVPHDRVEAAVRRLREANPMLGHRGCRLGNSYPEITEMQARAIFEAALAARRDGVDVRPEIMVPLVGHQGELRQQRGVVDRVAELVFLEEGERVEYRVGTMIELPRACLVAGEIAREADFFSFGTNDLTQTTLGISRDDAGGFLPTYVERGLYPDDPFQAIDRDGVGEMMRLGVERGRRTNPAIKLGICGEHGGEPGSIAFAHEIGLDYVSCSPFRVPVARLAAARAALEGEDGSSDRRRAG